MNVFGNCSHTMQRADSCFKTQQPLYASGMSNRHAHVSRLHVLSSPHCISVPGQIHASPQLTHEIGATLARVAHLTQPYLTTNSIVRHGNKRSSAASPDFFCRVARNRHVDPHDEIGTMPRRRQDALPQGLLVDRVRIDVISMSAID